VIAPTSVWLIPAVIHGSDIAAIVIAILTGAYLIYILLTAERL
jgi:threonine/homoserine/homoserine lactone efflux protein